jgi:hypothetical protein
MMKRMVNNLGLEDMKMKNYELIALLMELPAGYDIKFGKTVTKEDMNGEEAIFFEETASDIESNDIKQEIYILA